MFSSLCYYLNYPQKKYMIIRFISCFHGPKDDCECFTVVSRMIMHILMVGAMVFVNVQGKTYDNDYIDKLLFIEVMDIIWFLE